jgi:hypothetical protein
MRDLHRIDDPYGRYEPPGYKPDAPIPMTINGLTEVQQQAMRARQQAEQAMRQRLSNTETPARLAFTAYQEAVAEQRALNEEINAAYKREIDTLPEADRTLTEAAVRARKAEIRNRPVAKAVEIAEQAVRQRQAEAHQHYDELISKMVQPGDTAEELRRTRYLGAVEKQLAAVKYQNEADKNAKQVKVAERLMEQADASQLSLLVEQVPSLFAGHDLTWFEQKLIEINPELGAAVQDCTLADQTAAISNYAARSVRKGFESGHPPTQISRLAAAIPEYDPDLRGG